MGSESPCDYIYARWGVWCAGVGLGEAEYVYLVQLDGVEIAGR